MSRCAIRVVLLVAALAATAPGQTTAPATTQPAAPDLKQFDREALERLAAQWFSTAAAAQAENVELRYRLTKMETELERAKKALADSKTSTTGTPATPAKATPDAQQVIRPVLDQPASLRGLLDGLKGKQVAAGYMTRPLRVGSSGLVASIHVERIVDETNMVAQVLSPELVYPPMPRIGGAPGEFAVTTPGQFKLPTAKDRFWSTTLLAERVWITGIDTKGFVDGQTVYVTVPLEVVGTADAGGTTIFRLAQAQAKKPAALAGRPAEPTVPTAGPVTPVTPPPAPAAPATRRYHYGSKGEIIYDN